MPLWKYAAALFVLSLSSSIGVVLQTYETKTSDQENVLIELSKNSGGYKVAIDFSRQCGDFDGIVTKHFSDSTYQEPFFSALKDNRIGPDEIVVQLEGTTVQSLIAKTLNYCSSYYALFQIPREGIYRLKVLRLRKEFTAVKEIDSFPMIDYEVFVDKLVSTFLRRHIPAPCHRQSPMNGYWIANSNPLSIAPIQIMRPECDTPPLMLPNFTTYVMADRKLASSHCVQDVHLWWDNREDCLIRYRTNTFSADEDVESYDDDGGKPISVSWNFERNLTSNGAFFLGKKIIFIGDSHMRGFADLFLRRVCQFRHSKSSVYKQTGPFKIQTHIMSEDPSLCSKDDTTGTCESFHGGVNGLSVSYLSNMLCESGTGKYVEGYDYAVINCGHHPASKEHYSYSKYKSDVRLFIDEIISHRNTRIFWMENTAPPLRQDHWVVEKKDWRTYHRLMIFHSLAVNEARGLNASMTVIPAFRSTLALFDKICDCAHYPGPAKLPQLFGFLNSLKLFYA